MKKDKSQVLGGRLPYICVGICWLMIMLSFFGSDATDYYEHEGSVQKHKVATMADAEFKAWNFQCSDSALLNYTAPKRASGFFSQMDVPTKNCQRYNPMSGGGMLTSQSRSPQRRVPLSITASDLSCKPCVEQYHHGVVASTRRQFYFISPVLYEKGEASSGVRDVHVAVNLDTVLISTSRAHYDPSRERYFAFANVTVVVLALPTFGTLTILPGKWEFNAGNGTLVVTTDWASEMRSFLRTLFIFTKEEIDIQECDGREGACTRVCPPHRYPYLPCGSPVGSSGSHSRPFTRSPMGQKVIKGTNVGPAKVAFALAGLIRSVQFTGTSLHDLILTRHEDNAHVYISTWNVLGQMNRGVFGFGDKLVSPRRVSTLLKDIYDPYLKDSDVLDYEQYKPLLDALTARQFYYHGRVHIHISNVIRMIRESGKEYDIICITRPDVFWNTLVQFIAGSSLHIKVSYDARFNKIKHHTVQIHPGTVIVHKEGSEFAGNTYFVGDWVIAGAADTMLRWEELFSYAQDNFISHGGGASLAAFMAENGQYSVPVDFDLGLRKMACQRMSIQKVHERQLAIGLYDETSLCYWSTTENRL